MASIAGHMGPERLLLNWRETISATGLGLIGCNARGRQADGDLVTAASLAATGLAALLALPFLILTSLAAATPLAVPAGIALGYLGIAHAIVFRHGRRAAAWSFAVFSGLLGWTILLTFLGDAPRSTMGFIALLVAPLFAGAPALARYLLAGRQVAHRAALDRAACLDQLAPSEAVLFLDADGRLIAATRAGSEALGVIDGAAIYVDRQFSRSDRPMLLDALARSQAGAAPVEVTLRPAQSEEREGDSGRALLTATITAGPDRIATMRLSSASSRDMADSRTPAGAHQPSGMNRPANPAEVGVRCDVQEALSFVLRRVGPKAKAAAVALICEGDSDIAAGCDRRLCRRILQALIDNALGQSGRGDAIIVAARNLRGAVLLRVTLKPAHGEAAGAEVLRHVPELAALAFTIDEAGGTIMFDDTAEGTTISVRLASAGDVMAERRNGESAEAA